MSKSTWASWPGYEQDAGADCGVEGVERDRSFRRGGTDCLLRSWSAFAFDKDIRAGEGGHSTGLSLCDRLRFPLRFPCSDDVHGLESAVMIEEGSPLMSNHLLERSPCDAEKRRALENTLETLSVPVGEEPTWADEVVSVIPKGSFCEMRLAGQTWARGEDAPTCFEPRLNHCMGTALGPGSLDCRRDAERSVSCFENV